MSIITQSIYDSICLGRTISFQQDILMVVVKIKDNHTEKEVQQSIPMDHFNDEEYVKRCIDFIHEKLNSKGV